MNLKPLVCLLTGLSLSAAGAAQGISGTILIKKKLTRPSVTASVPIYQRGVAVKLGKDADDDPIGYERSRVVVYLEGSVAGGAPDSGPASNVEVQQLDRRFVPDVVVVPVGSMVSFPNMDPIFHNVYSLSKAKAFDLGSYDKGETRRVTFLKPGIIEVYCHFHPNMAATVVVTPNRYFARPDRTGHYSLPDVPPGHYTLVAWHRTAGFFRKSIDVEAGQTASADFLIPVEADSEQMAMKDRGDQHAMGAQ
jgi:plastocyanin